MTEITPMVEEISNILKSKLQLCFNTIQNNNADTVKILNQLPLVKELRHEIIVLKNKNKILIEQLNATCPTPSTITWSTEYPSSVCHTQTQNCCGGFDPNIGLATQQGGLGNTPIYNDKSEPTEEERSLDMGVLWPAPIKKRINLEITELSKQNTSNSSSVLAEFLNSNISKHNNIESQETNNNVEDEEDEEDEEEEDDEAEEDEEEDEGDDEDEEEEDDEAEEDEGEEDDEDEEEEDEEVEDEEEDEEAEDEQDEQEEDDEEDEEDEQDEQEEDDEEDEEDEQEEEVEEDKKEKNIETEDGDDDEYDEEDEEVEVWEKDGKKYYITDENNGIVYNYDDDSDIGEELGTIKNGVIHLL